MRKGIFISIALTFILSSVCWSAPIYNPVTGHWYDVVSSGQDGSWSNAESNAVLLGGHLVTINDAAEETWLRSNFGASTRYWIGFNDAAVEGTWVWSSGEAVTYTNWAGGEPNNSTPPPVGEDYAVLNWSGAAWNDWDHQRTDYRNIFGIAEIQSVPEPVTMLLLGLGLVGLAGVSRRKF